jgi:ribonuclease HII
VKSISAASIIAKVHRDRLCRELDAEHPQYGFASHKGYSTPEHLEALRRHGACIHHRRSFAPVRETLERAGVLLPPTAPLERATDLPELDA